MHVDLTDKVAIITGSAGGIGQRMARIFSQNGAIVVINDLNEEEGETNQPIRYRLGFSRTNVTRRPNISSTNGDISSVKARSLSY